MVCKVSHHVTSLKTGHLDMKFAILIKGRPLGRPYRQFWRMRMAIRSKRRISLANISRSEFEIGRQWMIQSLQILTL